MIRQENYPSETHTVTTDDGYILTIYRIPGPPGSIPVLLQHGLLESSADWLVPGRGRSLAYMLSDQGYDVWLGNARGNTYSKKHKKFSTSDPRFWDFSWHELGIYDLPAMINYITDLKKDNLFYIGHSMGASSLCVMAIERPEVAKKVRAMIGLAPAVYVYRMKASIRMLSPFSREFKWIANSLGIHEFLPRSNFFDSFARYICRSVMLRNAVCGNSLFLIAGFNPDQLDQIAYDSFQNYDYGVRINWKVYRTPKPPTYDLSKVQVPIAVFWSRNDWLVGGQDVKRFYSEIPIKIGIHEVEHKKFNHFDFLWAVNATNLVYTKVLDIMDSYENQISV
ncbi:hypothetical protein QAD02_011509 [Eretmocerus hayati]|uniref:Uncharacterized protein n=1 Tax=Eretmocerus hayati TaxID=131215 RepID=A0ACC2NXY9_9HYME|nr:hypothetical protein QAD02_011509 [Eretmocerus hayati]